MDTLYWLDLLQSHHRPLVGEKAFYLSALLQRGYPVANGFVIPATSFRQFLESVPWSEPLGLDLSDSSLYLDVDNPRQLQRVSQKIRQEIMAGVLPPSWLSTLESAVRAVFERIAHVATEPKNSTDTTALLLCSPSIALGELGKISLKQLSPLISFQTEGSGEAEEQGGREVEENVGLSSHLPISLSPLSTVPSLLPQGLYENYICSPDLEALTLSLKQTWAELFRARSLFYWQRAGIGLQQLNLAILVQPLWQCVASGNLQSDTSSFSIQATWGHSHALSKSEVIPDSFRVHPETGEVQSQQLGSKTLAYGFADWDIGEKLLMPNFQFLSDRLQAYLVGEEQQKQYALPEKYFKQLIELAQQLRSSVGKVFELEWTLSLTKENLEPTLHLAQIAVGGMAPFPSQVRGSVSPTSEHEPLSATEQRHSQSEADLIVSPPLLGSSTTQLPSPGGPEVVDNSKVQLVRGLAASAGRAIAKAQVISGFRKNVEVIPSGRVLVTKSVTPDWLPLLKRSAGIVAEQGGMTCHAAIMARELGIPAVVGAAGATQFIKTGDLVLVDGDRGTISHVSDRPSSAYEQEPMTEERKPRTKDKQLIATQLLVTLSQPEFIEPAAAEPVDGVGLLRSELMMLAVLEHRHPNWWVSRGRQRELVQTLSEVISQFARSFAPRPIYYRSLDLRSHEFQSLASDTETQIETNPMLGMRGTFSYMSDPTLFDLELAALAQVQQSGYTNVRLLLPFVRTVEEFSFCRSRAIAAGLTHYQQFQLWIVAEVPSVLFLLPAYVKAGVQGVSIGTNDLTQLLLGVDRDQAEMQKAFDERHPAVLQAIRSIIQLARTAGIPCSICGLAPSRFPEIIDHLIAAGITSISVELNAVERTYQAIARAEQRLLLEAARQQLGYQADSIS